MDSWIVWNLTGGIHGGVHLTDVTNASRTLLMNLATLKWDEEILNILQIPPAMLPAIVPSSQPYALATGELAGIPVAGILGVQPVGTCGFGCKGENPARS